MNPARMRLLQAGLEVGLVYGLATHLVWLFRHGGANYVNCSILSVSYVVIALPGLLLRREVQVDWYRRALFLPWASLYGAGLVAVGVLGNYTLGILVVLAAMIVLPAAPLVWLIGALYMWRSHRRMRSLARRVH
jgi:hypothetical protein